MNTGVGRAHIGQWYLRWDKGEIFQVTGCDPGARTIEIQTFDGDVAEYDDETWASLPLGFADPPEDWTGPADDGEADGLDSETGVTAETTVGYWVQPLEPPQPGAEGEQSSEEA